MTTKRNNPGSLWRTLQEEAAADDLEEILAMSETELDAYITKEGGDPVGIRARGAAHAKALDERLTTKAWHDEMEAKHERFRDVAAANKSTTLLPRDVLLQRLGAARNNPRFSERVATLFQKEDRRGRNRPGAARSPRPHRAPREAR